MPSDTLFFNSSRMFPVESKRKVKQLKKPAKSKQSGVQEVQHQQKKVYNKQQERCSKGPKHFKKTVGNYSGSKDKIRDFSRKKKDKRGSSRENGVSEVSVSDAGKADSTRSSKQFFFPSPEVSELVASSSYASDSVLSDSTEYRKNGSEACISNKPGDRLATVSVGQNEYSEVRSHLPSFVATPSNQVGVVDMGCQQTSQFSLMVSGFQPYMQQDTQLVGPLMFYMGVPSHSLKMTELHSLSSFLYQPPKFSQTQPQFGRFEKLGQFSQIPQGDLPGTAGTTGTLGSIASFKSSSNNKGGSGMSHSTRSSHSGSSGYAGATFALDQLHLPTLPRPSFV